MARNWRDIGARVEKQTALAMAYIGDGALHTGAKILAELAQETAAAAKSKDRSLNRYIAGYNRRTDELNRANGH